ncbi:MAG: alpha/beta fold hydrolase [Pseudomonadota bacterium]
MPSRRFRIRYLFVALFLAATAVVVIAYVPDRSVAELAHWQTPASRFVDVDGMRVHYRREGPADAPTLVLLHGTAASLHTWDGSVEALSTDFDVVRMDLPGFGLTGPHVRADYRIASYADFVEDVVDALGLETFALAGNSLGGNISWQFAATRPERVSSLILLDPSGLPPESAREPSLVFRLASTPVLRNILTLFAPNALYEDSLLEVYADDSKVTPELIRRYRELSLREGNRQAFVDRTLQYETSDPRRLEDIVAPTLILWGAEDVWIPVEDAARFDAGIADSRVIIYPDLGHIPMEEAPARTAADARAFLESLGD